MSAKPADRPSARQVLQSDLLPPRVEDEQLKDLLRSLPDNPIAYERVVDSLFNISSSKERSQGLPGLPRSTSTPAAAAAATAACNEANPAAAGVDGLVGSGLLTSQQCMLPLSELPGAPLDCHLDVEEAVCRVVKEVCSVHGALQMSSTSLGLSHMALPKVSRCFEVFVCDYHKCVVGAGSCSRWQLSLRTRGAVRQGLAVTWQHMYALSRLWVGDFMLCSLQDVHCACCSCCTACRQ
jgi:hypothetical protein